MKWCRFQSGRNVAYGVIDGTTVWVYRYKTA